MSLSPYRTGQPTPEHEALKPIPRSSRIALFAVLLALVPVFWIPARMTPPLIWSDSYMFGFNNRVCELLFGAVILLTAALAKFIGFPLPRRTSSLNPAGPLTTRLLAVCLALTSGLCAFFYWLSYSVGGLGDGAYFLDRIHLIARGEVPFRDFEFVYGSFSLYASVFLGRFLHLGADNGYYILWWAETLLGIVLFWFALRWIDLPAAGKRTIFLLYFAAFFLFVPAITLNYCALRYTLPLFGLTALCRLDRNAAWTTRLQFIAAAILLALCLIGLSPEEGLVFAIAIVVCLPLRRWATQRAFAADTVLLIAGFFAFYWLSERAGAFGTMKRFGAGAFNLPIYPGPAILFAFAAVLGMVAYLCTGPVAVRARSNVLLLTVFGLGMLPGAMGRCDTLHIEGYLLPIFVCAMLLCRRNLRLWRSATLAFVTLFLLLPLIGANILTPPTLSKALLVHVYGDGGPHSRLAHAIDHAATRLAVRALGPQRGAEKIATLRHLSVTSSLDPHSLFPGASPVLAVPFEYSPNKASNYQAPDIDEGFYMGLSNITVPQQIDLKIAELESHPTEDLVVSEEGFTQCFVHTGDPRVIRWLLEIPWVPQPKHSVFIFVPYCTYIQTHYDWLQRPSIATFSYGLMRRKRD